MRTLHGILAELGIEKPAMHADPAFALGSGWRDGQSFRPLPGHTYEVAFRRIPANPHDSPVIKRVRTDAASPSSWRDADTGAALPFSLEEMSVIAFRKLN